MPVFLTRTGVYVKKEMSQKMDPFGWKAEDWSGKLDY